jgi:hypothetical protein
MADHDDDYGFTTRTTARQFMFGLSRTEQFFADVDIPDLDDSEKY